MFDLYSLLELCLLHPDGIFMATLVQLLQLLADVRRAAFHDLVAGLFMFIIHSIFILSFCNVQLELSALLLLLLPLNCLLASDLLLQLDTHHLSLHC